MNKTLARKERGATLLVTLVFLLIFAALTAAIYRNSLSSAQAIGNMQWRNESISAANDAIDRLLSNADFAKNPTLVTETVNKTPFAYDANGDGVNDIQVSFPEVTIDGVTRAGPRCVRAEPIPNKDLDPLVEEDRNCLGSADPNLGFSQATLVGTGSRPTAGSSSVCANTEWTVTVRATDALTNTSVDVVQGVGVRTWTSAVTTCN